MIIAIIYISLSFLLDGIISNYIPFELANPSYLKTIYTIISLVIMYHYFYNKKKYLIILIILGLLFDMVYTNTFLVNATIFITLYIILYNIDYLMPTNIITINIKSMICISTYHILTYIILLLSHFNNYEFSLLVKIILRSIIMTFVYTTISYLIINKIYLDKKIK